MALPRCTDSAPPCPAHSSTHWAWLGTSHDYHVTLAPCDTPPLRAVYEGLSRLRHWNGERACQLYCETDFADALRQGPIVNFNLLGVEGGVLGYHQVEKLASVYDIHLRTGCFCNTGACMKHLSLSSDQLRHHLEVSVHACIQCLLL